MSEKLSNTSPRHPRFMRSTEASRASIAKQTTPTHSSVTSRIHCSPISKRKHLINRATQRLTSFSASKTRSSRLPVSSPLVKNHLRKSSLVLSSPIRRVSHLPEPIKKALVSPTEKALPSLPVASFIGRSPINRRSLLDATERPLRRSLLTGPLEDWPALSPLRSSLRQSQIEDAAMSVNNTSVQPSLGESVLEGMRQLHLDDNDNIDFLPTQNRLNTRSKADPLNFTPRPVTSSASKHDSRTFEVATTRFLDPRPVPATPEATRPRRSSSLASLASLGRRASLQGLSLLKTRRSSKSDMKICRQESTSKSKPPSSYPVATFPSQDQAGDETSDDKLQSSALKSALPRSRIVSITGSPRSIAASTSPKIIRLKRAKGQVTDTARRTGARSITPNGDSDETVSARVLSRANSVRRKPLPRISSPPSPFRTKAIDILLDEDTVGQENDPVLPPKTGEMTVHDSDESGDEDQLKRMHNFKFPAQLGNEIGDEDHSELTRVTSISSKAGTIYDRDEHGGYRLKPVSKADPKHGPRVRIEDSADDLLLQLDETQLATTKAKREAYEKRYAPHSEKQLQSAVDIRSTQLYERNILELASLRESGGKALTTETGNDPRKALSSPRSGRLAPAVPLNIPTLAHSPTGWPLMISKIAPFAEIDDEVKHDQESAAEWNIRKVPTTPVRDPANEDNPTSAYTLRTALSKITQGEPVRRSESRRSGLLVLDQAVPTNEDQPHHQRLGENAKRFNSKPQPRKSSPEIASKPIFPARTSSRTASSLSSSLKRRSNGFLKSHYNQHTMQKSKNVTTKPNASPPPQGSLGASHTHPHIRYTSPPPVAKYMKSYHATSRQVNSGSDVEPDIPSSPPIFSGSVSTGKPTKMVSKFSGLFHKTSHDSILRRSASRLTMKRQKSMTQLDPENEYQSSPLSSPPLTVLGLGSLAHAAGGPHTSGTERNNSLPLPVPSSKHWFPRLHHTSSKILNVHQQAILTPPSSNPHLRSNLHDSGLSVVLASPPPSPSPTPIPTLARAASISTPNSELHSNTPLQSSTLESTELCRATDLAFVLLDRAQGSFAHTRQRQEYIEMARFLIEMASHTRNVERLAEEARQVEIRMGMEVLKMRREVERAVEVVEGWRPRQ